MKKILFTLMLLISACINAQEEDLSFSKVIQQKDKTAIQLYPIIKAWVASSFNSARDVIQMDDEKNGILICRGAYDYKYPGGINYTYINGYITYTLKIQVKEGRYKIDMSKFTHYSTSEKFTEKWSMGVITNREKFNTKAIYKIYNKAWENIKEQSLELFNKIVLDLEKATSGNTQSFEEEW